MSKYQSLELKNQICFPLYLVAKKIISAYKELLEPLNLTYTQYLVMLVIWKNESIQMKTLGEKLQLDSNTLTPLVDRLLKKRYINKQREPQDRRILTITLEPKGKELREQALDIPNQIFLKTGLTPEEAKTVKTIAEKILMHLDQKEES